MGKLVLLDGNSIANRAFYALPLLSNKQGIYTNGVYGFTQIIMKILNDIKPDYLLVAFDAGKKTFRHKDFADYKGTRQKTPMELSGQFPLIKEILDAFEIKYFELNEYEADDIIGTLAKQSEEANLETIIYTGDKDMLQLASTSTSIYLTKKGITEVDIYNPETINEKYQLIPEQIIDLKGLMGDSSDNIPGIPGIGEKTALKLLHEFNSVENILDNVENIKGKLKEKIDGNKDKAILSKKLATIYKDVPMNLKLNDLKYKGYDNDGLYQCFKKFEFNTLIDRLDITNNENEKIIEMDKQNKISIDTISKENKTKWNKKFNSNKELSLFVESERINIHQHNILGLAISDGEEHIFINQNELYDWNELIDWLENKSASKLVFDAKTLEMNLYWDKINVEGITFDLMLAVYLINPSDGTIELSEIAQNYGIDGIVRDEIIYGKGAKRTIPTDNSLGIHLAQKSKVIYLLKQIIEEKLNSIGLLDLFYNIEMPIYSILANMEKNGIYINTSRLDVIGTELNAKLDQLTKEIYNISGEKFNINSPKQLGKILFERLNLPIIKKTKTGYSTSADVLEKLANKHEIVEKILLYRQLGKLKSTYIEGLLKMVNPDTGKIHTSFNQALTATGRLSSTEPNLQNIPIRLEEGRKIREAFIPKKDDWFILSADYSQIELRVLAHISKDKNLIEAFLNDMDIHTKTAMDVFGVKEEEVTSIMRRQAKAVNFGIVYGISDYGLAQNLNISRKDAADFIEKYFTVFIGVKQYMNEIIKTAKEKGYVSTLLNRRRYLPDINSKNFNIRSFAERIAMNTPIQGTAADIIKVAMVNINKEINKQQLNSKLLLQVHDELIFEVPKNELSIMNDLVKEIMETAIQLAVPLKVDINTGRTWYETK